MSRGAWWSFPVIILVFFSVSAYLLYSQIPPDQPTEPIEMMPMDFNRKEVAIGLSLFPPYAYRDEMGRTVGLSVEYLKGMMEKLGLPHRFFFIPLQRLRYAFAQSDVDLMLGTESQYSRNNEHCLITDQPILKMRMRLYGRKLEELPEFSGEVPLKLSNVKIGQMRAYTFLGAVDLTDSTVIYADSHKQLMKMLHAGKLDYVIDYQVPAQKALEELDMTGIASREIVKVPLYILLRKGYPNSYEIMQKLNLLIGEGGAH